MSQTDLPEPVDDHADLPARIDAATAMRRLSHALVAHRADASTLHMIATEAERLAIEIESQPRRDRHSELISSPRFLSALGEGSLADVMEDGAFVDLFHDSPGSGSANPMSIGMRIRREDDEAVGAVTLAAGWQGAPGRSHGGVVAACVDETLGALLPIIDVMAFTGELSIRYVAPCPLGVPIEFRARHERTEGRKLHLVCTGTGPDGVFVESTAVFIAVDLPQYAAMTERETR